MLTAFQWTCLLSILAAAFAGGYFPLFRGQKTPGELNFPLREAFTVGVFLALAMTMMLPSSLHLLGKAFPNIDFPLGAVVAVTAYLSLLALEHATHGLKRTPEADQPEGPSSPLIPIIMTLMIAIPSFFLGTAFGVSETESAIIIFVAIMIHKFSAAFALALIMVRSSLTRGQVLLTFSLFAFSTPAGIIVGEEIHQWLTPETMTLVKGLVLGLASGTFLYMATLHDLRNCPMITRCGNRVGFLVMLTGFFLTALVRFLIGEAHKMG